MVVADHDARALPALLGPAGRVQVDKADVSTSHQELSPSPAVLSHATPSSLATHWLQAAS